MSVMSVRLSDDIEQKLVQLALSTGRTKSWLASQAIQDYLDREVWLVAEIQAALGEADSGDFVPEQEMNAKFQRWGINAG
ncbi:MAG: CopG family ribbon-helix-helix protein [Shewanella sp.]